MSNVPPYDEGAYPGTMQQDVPFSRFRSGFAVYGVAGVFVALALLLRLTLNAVLGGEAPYLPFVVATIGAAWYGGFWPGIFATVLGGMIATIFFLEPVVTIPFTSLRATLWFFTFLGIGCLVSWLNESLHRSLRQVRASFSKQQAAETKAMASESWFRQAIEEAPVPILLHADDDSILSVNRIWRESTGYTLEQLPRLSDWIEKVSGNKEQARAAANRIFGLDQGRVEHGEFTVVTAKGENLIWDFSSAVLGRLPDGRLVAIGMAKDITARKHVETQLVRLNTAVEGAANGVVIVNREGVILWVNSAFTKMTGYTKDEAVGQHTRFLKSGVHDHKFYQNLWSTVIAGRVWRGVLCNCRKDGSRYHEEMTITPVMGDHKNVLYFVAIKEDITEKQHLQSQLQQAQKMEAVGQLAGGVAHDFNNLLTIINGYSEIVQTQLAEDNPLRGLVREIGQAGERAASLTRQLLAFSRKQVLEPKVLSLNAIVSDTTKMLKRLIGEDVDLDMKLDPHLGQVKADAGQTEQVLINLAVNARDAMPRGGKLTIETANVELDETYTQAFPELRPGAYVMMSVTDTGTGMDEATKSRIFEPFFTTKGAGRGTGLGLATVFGIIKQSQGHIGVYTELNRGTTFKVYLPRIDQAALVGSAPKPGAAARGAETILLTEDEPSLRTLAGHILRTYGYTVLEAESGDRALRIAETFSGALHLLATDVVMPGMSGAELAERLARVRPQTRVLYLSGYTDDAVVRHGILAAERAFLQKPFTPAALARKVREVLDA